MMGKKMTGMVGALVLGLACCASPSLAQDTDDTTGAGPAPMTTAVDRDDDDDDDDDFDLGLLGLIGLLGLGGLLRRDHRHHEVVTTTTGP